MDSTELPPAPLPYLHLVRATRPSAPALTDVVAATRATLDTLDKAKLDLPAGAPVAVAVGSRGIATYAKIAGAVVAWLKERGMRPFITPAMGSHGGATAEAQQAVLAKYGIDEAHMGVPVRSSMETVLIGVTESGVEVFMDKHAFEAGRVLLVNRVKPHTTFIGKVESGIMKMAAIGLGNLEGARRFHSSALRMGFEKALLEMARVNLRSGKLLGGVAILENDAHQTAGIEAMAAANLEIEEPRLLIRAREIRPQLPFRNLDLLIVDELGKDISGTGMDTRVTGRSIHQELDGADSTGTTPGFIRIRRIYVRDLTHATEGNACGAGQADMVHERLFRKTNFTLTNVNATTSLGFLTARMPMWFPCDRDAIFFAMRNMGLPSPEEVKIVRIKNTNRVDSFLASPACVRDLRDADHSGRYSVGDGNPLDFDEVGDVRSVVGISGT
jgi:hypothetical protein